MHAKAPANKPFLTTQQPPYSSSRPVSGPSYAKYQITSAFAAPPSYTSHFSFDVDPTPNVVLDIHTSTLSLYPSFSR